MESVNYLYNRSILNFKLDQYDGPLDLLVQLIKEKKMDILTVDIADLTYQYLEFVNKNLIHLPIDMISEYLVMASYLTELKTKSLINAFTNFEDVIENELEIDQLRRRIFLYNQYKDIINEFRTRQSKRIKYIAKKCDDLDEYIPEDVPEAPLKDHISIDKIVSAWQRIVVDNRNKQEVKPFIIKVNNIDVDKVEANLINFVENEENLENVPYEDFVKMFIKNKVDLEHYCAIFLCLLVLAKNGYIKIRQDEFLGPIYISKNNEVVDEHINEEILNALKYHEQLLKDTNEELNKQTDISSYKQNKIKGE